MKKIKTKKINKTEPPAPLTVSIVLDYMGGGEETSEDEYLRLTKELAKIIANPLSCHDSKMVHHIQQGSRLVLFDFGGLMPGSNLMEDQSREVIRWAGDNPNALVLVISAFTFRNFIEPEMQDLGLKDLHNVQLWLGYADQFPEWPGITLKAIL